MTTVASPRKRVNVHTCDLPTDETAAALRAALRAAPADATLAGVLRDRYLELGYTARTADVWVRRTIRWAEVKALLESSGAKGGRVRGHIRRLCGVGSCPSVPIALVGGVRSAEAPALTGEPPYHTFRRGGVCHSPGAAIRAGYKVEYHADTRSITVGVSWLAARMEEVSRG